MLTQSAATVKRHQREHLLGKLAIPDRFSNTVGENDIIKHNISVCLAAKLIVCAKGAVLKEPPPRDLQGDVVRKLVDTPLIITGRETHHPAAKLAGHTSVIETAAAVLRHSSAARRERVNFSH